MRQPVKTALTFILGAVVGVFVIRYVTLETIMGSKFAVKTKEPLVIAGDDPKVMSLLPSGTVLYQEKSWPEGHTTYKVYFHFKGHFESDPFEPEKMSPLWLYNLDKGDIIKFMGDYPLTLGDLRRILKAQKVTREEYIQILRDWEEPDETKQISITPQKND